ncbi:ImmA/IrrE family metallo-endopeptidase [Soehngenia longivitae]|jgi:Zn-dependent peptidase ImmA (M78 family)|uniref:ImmA/IrrE family metallo-endopeptidase n=1 Tax=Soehngenia longivitae TaxID=2562294 RepID=A0A4Z0D7D3_9FIRM|nr:ImmA/IrrE family metallo-endopeptidase [Soehngenia longivitae]TFZ40792.1 ImmA/IrrE family metallo-endopeptidase [Soehngenia longivitae]
MRKITLNDIEVNEICRLAGRMRLSLGFVDETPIANDIFTILDRLDIILLEYPIKSENDRPAFSAAIMYFEEVDKKLTFIGLNTADYYDKQIFAIAHELYHYETKTGSHLSRLSDEENSLIEAKANRFAAEFLLPEKVLSSIILDEFKTSKLEKIPYKTLLRFIARLQCTWWLPYRSLVKRLYEIDAISLEQYEKLYSVDERDLQGEYGKIGQAINKEVFINLNQPTNNIGTSANEIEIIIRNFEDNLIDEEKFAETLSLFNRTPDEFGYEIKVSQEDRDDLDAFFGGDGNED